MAFPLPLLALGAAIGLVAVVAKKSMGPLVRTWVEADVNGVRRIKSQDVSKTMAYLGDKRLGYPSQQTTPTAYTIMTIIDKETVVPDGTPTVPAVSSIDAAVKAGGYVLVSTSGPRLAFTQNEASAKVLASVPKEQAGEYAILKP